MVVSLPCFVAGSRPSEQVPWRYHSLIAARAVWSERVFSSVAAGRTLPADSVCERDWDSACPDGLFMARITQPANGQLISSCFVRLVDVGRGALCGSVELRRLERTSSMLSVDIGFMSLSSSETTCVLRRLRE